LFEAYDVDDRPPALEGASVGEALLRVHRSYLPAIQALLHDDLAQGLAHITGGGLPGNLARILPAGCAAAVDYEAWTRPPLFSLIQEQGAVPEADMRRTFNLGVGLVAVVRPEAVEAATSCLAGAGVPDAVRIGRVVSDASSDASEAPD